VSESQLEEALQISPAMASVLPNASSPSKVPHPDEFNPYWAYVGGAFFFFTVVNYLARYCTPRSALWSYQQSWKWRNIATSLVHSAITATWAPLCFYRHPDMSSDLAYAFNHSTHMLVSFSIGYFIYDFFDMYLYNQKQGQKNTYELLLHHACAITCFGISSHKRTLLPFASLALVVEINSIFLHSRQLFIIAGMARQTKAYKNVALLNVATFVPFRIVLLCWMARWLTLNKDTLPILFSTVGAIGVTIILVMNAILLYRIIARDYFCSSADFVKGNGANGGVAKGDPGGEGVDHPVSKDVNRIMKNFFEPDEAGPVGSKNRVSKKDD
jgi:hypothetical protein